MLCVSVAGHGLIADERGRRDGRNLNEKPARDLVRERGFLFLFISSLLLCLKSV